MVAVRTCIACREHAVRNELLRFVLQGDQLVADHRAVRPGRGAWVHPTSRCLDQAVSRGLFARALRTSIPIDVNPQENWMRNPHGSLMNGSK